MTERVTISMKPETRKLLNLLAKKRKASVSALIDEWVQQAAAAELEQPKQRLGDMLASLKLKPEYADCLSAQEILTRLRTAKYESS